MGMGLAGSSCNIPAGGGVSVKRAPADDPLIVRHDPRPAYFRQLGRMFDLEAVRGSGLRLVHEVMHGSGFGCVAKAKGKKKN